MAGAGGAGAGGAGAGGAGESGAGGANPGASGFLRTRGGQIVDAGGNVVRLTGLSWFGMETSNFAPHGLWSRSLGGLLDQVRDLGYNSLRLPFSNQLFDPGSAPNGIDFAKNPELQGLGGLEILDRVIAAAGERGLKVVLDRHRPDASAQSPLWYTPQISEQRWIDDWKMLARRYRGNSTVVGADLHNEPHGEATWGDGNQATDWRLAAERAGNAILGENPDLLIIVEGVERVGDASTWWGGNLSAAGAHPVRLALPDRLVYSPHEYPASVFAQPWFADPAYPGNLRAIWQRNWGYLAEGGVAPIWVGEFGTRYQTASDRLWLGELAGYLLERQLSFAFWCLNPNSGDTGGILQDDWQSVNADKQAALQQLLAPPIR
jgi:aryl-phospho-beta-D-glucosidase BglC (GH1 family)